VTHGGPLLGDEIGASVGNELGPLLGESLGMARVLVWNATRVSFRVADRIASLLARRSHLFRCRLDHLSHLSSIPPAMNALMAVVRIFSTRCSARVAGATLGRELGAALGVKLGLLLGDELGLVFVHMVYRVTLG
jgi:tetrahydromethanopterin S-methyltransferase subunit G